LVTLVKMRTLRAVCAFVIVVCAGVGAPVYLSGCDATLQPNCGRYNVVTATTVNHTVVPYSCLRCAWRLGGDCAWIWLPCFDSFALRSFVLNDARQSCAMGVATNAPERQLALAGRPCYKRPTLWHSTILVVHLPLRLHLLLHFYRSTVLTMYHYCPLLFHRLLCFACILKTPG